MRVNRVVLTARPSLPVYPEKRTIPEPVGTSQRCQIQTSTNSIFSRSIIKPDCTRTQWLEGGRTTSLHLLRMLRTTQRGRSLGVIA
jgi:hypothetical protein